MSHPASSTINAFGRWRVVAAAFAALAVTAGLQFLVAPGAQSAVLATEKYTNEATGRCLEDTTTDPRAAACAGVSSQDWIVVVWGDGTRRFQNGRTGQCLTIGGDVATTTLKSYTCDSSQAQSWWITRWADGTIRFRNQLTGKCIVDAGGSVGAQFLRTCDTSEAQSWY